MINLEDRCAWKEISEVEIISEGKLGECKKCDGYNVGCFCYNPVKEKETKFRVYKVR